MSGGSNQHAGGQGRKKTPTKSKKRKRDPERTQGLRELQDNMKCNNIHIIRIPEREEKEQGVENLFEKVMMENFPNLMREKVTQIQEAQRVPIKMNPKRSTPIHIIIKMAKFKDIERILKSAKEKQLVTYNRSPMRLSPDYSR